MIYEEEDFVVINKPAGLIVHGAHPSVVDWLLKKYPEVAAVGDNPAERPGIVHRLDKDTSGVILIPRTQAAFDYFKNCFQIKQIIKTYFAVVYGCPKEKEGVIDKPIGLNSSTVKHTVHTKRAKMVKDAITKYMVQKTFDVGGVRVSLLRVEPLTGRTHQIRVHLASIGCPIVGDRLYGSKKQKIDMSHQLLHADSIEFLTPQDRRLTISADAPKEWGKIME